MTKGKFIVIEGLDGSGKGTQITLLTEALRRMGSKVHRTAEPTDSVTGGLLRDALGGFVQRDAYELSALFLSDRIFHTVMISFDFSSTALSIFFTYVSVSFWISS